MKLFVEVQMFDEQKALLRTADIVSLRQGTTQGRSVVGLRNGDKFEIRRPSYETLAQELNAED